MTLTIGQELWFVPNDRRSDPFLVIVHKVGHKWAGVTYGRTGRDWGRINIETLRMDGGEYPSPGRCYLSKAHYDLEMAREIAWSRIRHAMRNHYGDPPKTVTTEQIIQAAQLLGIDIFYDKLGAP